MLTIEDLSLTIDDRLILNQVNLSLAKGQKLALLGANGSGKTSLLRVLAGLTTEQITGRVRLDGCDLLALSIDERVRAGLGLIYQNPPILPDVSLRQLAEFLPNALPTNLQIEAFGDRGLGSGLSGGEKKRLELAQMIALQPKLWLIDELDAGLDAANLQKIGQILAEQLADKTAIIVSHNQRIFEFVKPDLAAILRAGRVVSQGDFAEIMAQYRGRDET